MNNKVKTFIIIGAIVIISIICIFGLVVITCSKDADSRVDMAYRRQTLGAVRAAQAKYAVELGNDKTTSDCSRLVMDRASLKYLKWVKCFQADIRKPDSIIASLTGDRQGEYTITISVNGKLSCTDGKAIACPEMY